MFTHCIFFPSFYCLLFNDLWFFFFFIQLFMLYYYMFYLLINLLILFDYTSAVFKEEQKCNNFWHVLQNQHCDKKREYFVIFCLQIKWVIHYNVVRKNSRACTLYEVHNKVNLRKNKQKNPIISRAFKTRMTASTNYRIASETTNHYS